MFEHADKRIVIGAVVLGGLLGALFGSVADQPVVFTIPLFALIFGGVAAFRSSATNSVLNAALGKQTAGSYAGVSYNRETISFQGQTQPIAGATATVETAGSLTKYADVSNMAIGGALLGKAGVFLGAQDKTSDTRELYLLIRGRRHHWVARVNPNHGQLARTFAARVTSAGLVDEAPAPAKQVSDAPAVTAPAAGSVAQQIRDLKELLDAGTISEDEFAAAKRKLLS